MYIPLLRYVDKLITQKIYCCFTPHIYFTVKQSFEPLCLLSIGNHRRSNTTALVRSTAEIFRNLELSQRLPFAPKGVACWYKLFKNSLTEFHIQSDFSLTELNIAIMVIPFNALFVVITTSPPQNTPLFANLCTVLS